MTQKKKRARSYLLKKRQLIKAMAHKTVQKTIFSKRLIMSKKKGMEQESDYMNSDFILGSVAEVERLLSILLRLLPEYRKSCTPILSEALLFLKVNSNYWDLSLVCKAVKKVHDDKVAQKIAADQQEASLVSFTNQDL